jgi:hypothetical protein
MSLARPHRPTVSHEENAAEVAASRGLKDLIRDNGLSLVMFGLFFLFLIGQSIAGWMEYNETQRAHHETVVAYLSYLQTGHFFEALFENWESEFLQMAAYVSLTACLIQKGSAESKKPPEEGENPQDEDPSQKRNERDVPGPVRKGGLMLWLYEQSLALALFFLFAVSFAGHAIAGAKEYSQDQLAHGEQAVTTIQYLGTSRFWFESLQNWQSEFLAVFALVVLSIWLRGKGSPESKPVAAPHSQTGSG